MLVTTALLIAGGVSIIALIKHRMRAGRPVVAGMLAGGWGIAGNGLVGDMLARGSQALARSTPPPMMMTGFSAASSMSMARAICSGLGATLWTASGASAAGS